MSVFTVRVELAPIPDVDGTASTHVCMSASVVVAGTSGSMVFESLVASLAASAGTSIPSDPDDGDVWKAIEEAFQTHTPELLPWLWTDVEFSFYGSNSPGMKLDSTAVTMPSDALGPSSKKTVRRAILRTIHGQSLSPAVVPHALQFDQADGEPLTGFRLPPLMAQSCLWPAPIPHLALRNVFVFRISRAEIGALQGALFAVPSFTVNGRRFLGVEPAVISEDPDTHVPLAGWTFSNLAEPDRVAGEATGLSIDKLLDPSPWVPQLTGSFCDPYKELWLSSQAPDQPADTLSATDWQSRLPSALESAAETPARFLEALRHEVAEGREKHFDAETFRSAIAALRDILGVGVIVDRDGRLYHRFDSERSLDAPPAVRLLFDCRDPDDSKPLDLWQHLGDGRQPSQVPQEEEGRMALLRCLCAYEARFAADGTAAWIDLLIRAWPALATWLPPAKDIAETLVSESPAATLARLDAIYRSVTDPSRHCELLLFQWREAIDSMSAANDKELAGQFLTANRARLTELVTHRNWMEEMRRAAALTLVRDTARTAGAFAQRVLTGLHRYAEHRFAKDCELKPRLERRPDRLTEVIAQAARRINETLEFESGGRPQPEPAPSGLFIQLDTLHDDDASQHGEPDHNSKLRGYSSFMRWRNRRGDVGDWSCPHIGVAWMPCWSKLDYLETEKGAWVEVLGVHEVGATHGVRQVGIHLEDRPWLRAAGLSTVPVRAQVADEQVQDLLVVVNRPSGTNPSGIASTVPPLGFGIEYQFLPFAVGASTALPPPLATGHPSVLAPSGNWRDVLNAKPARSRRYLRRVGVNAVLVHYDLRNQPTVNARRFLVPADLPVAGHAIDPQAGTDIHAQERTASSAPPLVVLLSSEGDGGSHIDPAWQQCDLQLEAPDCSASVYRRWCTGRRFDDAPEAADTWKAWIERIDAADDLKQRLAGDEALRRRLEIEPHDLPRLHDPAVGGIHVRWVPLRALAGKDGAHVLSSKISLPGTPSVPDDANPVHSLLAELTQTNAPNWTVRLRLAPDAGVERFDVDAAARVLIVNLWPGEIGELQYSAAVAVEELTHDTGRFDPLVFDPNEMPADDTGGWRLFPAQRTRIEVATRHRISPADLYEHLRVRAESDGRMILRFDRDGRKYQATGPLTLPDDAGERERLLAFDNIASLKVRWQAWRPAGKPQTPFPADQIDLDATAPANGAGMTARALAATHAIAWDAEGFAERAEDAGTLEREHSLGVRPSLTDVFVHEPNDATPRYLRMATLATHRNRVVYENAGVAHSDQLEDVEARLDVAGSLPTSWRRALRPGSRDTPVAPPQVKLIVPLTRPALPRQASAGQLSSDLLVVLNEQWHLQGGLAETLECVIDVAERPIQQETSPEAAPDPIIDGAAASRHVVAVSTLGPLGHTFDTDSREPLFVATSFLLMTSEVFAPFDFAKISLRRVLTPELMVGYFAVPPVDENEPLAERYARLTLSPEREPHLAAADLTAAGEGIISLDRFPATNARFDIRFGDLVWTIVIDRTDPNGCRIKPDGTLNGRIQDETSVSFDGAAQSNELSLRIVAKRIREAGALPARWELALYIRTTTDLHGISARWQRIGHWRGDEPAKLDEHGLSMRPPTGLACRHVAALAANRHSAYVEGEWAQVLGNADAAPIAGVPWWREPASSLDDFVLDRSLPSKIHLRRRDGRQQVLAWRDQPVPRGEEGQGLFHAALLTKEVSTGDGAPSEAFVGLFKLNAESGVLTPLDAADGATDLPTDTILRAYVLLVQANLHETVDIKALWETSFPLDEQGRPLNDAAMRILSVSRPIVSAPMEA